MSHCVDIDVVVRIALHILNKSINYDLTDSCMLELRLLDVFEEGRINLEKGYQLFGEIIDDKFSSLNDKEEATKASRSI